MQELIIKTETEAVKKALVQFFKAYRDHLSDYLNMELREQGHLGDAGVKIEGEEGIIVYQVAQDKGYVLGEVDAAIPLQMISWANLKEDSLYVKSTKEGLTLYLKSEAGIPDVKIGLFISMDDAVTNFNSEKVKTAVLSARESKKIQLKQIKKLEKLGKVNKIETVPGDVVEVGDDLVEQIPGDITA